MIIKRQIGEKGQIVIPRDIRRMLNLHKGKTVNITVREDEIIIKNEQSNEEFLKDFLNVPKPKKNLTLKDLRKMEDESYDLP